MSDQSAVVTEVRGRVLLITLNRPDQMNAVNTDLAQGLVAAIRELDENPELTAGVLTVAGRGRFAQEWTSKHSSPMDHQLGSTSF